MMEGGTPSSVLEGGTPSSVLPARAGLPYAAATLPHSGLPSGHRGLVVTPAAAFLENLQQESTLVVPSGGFRVNGMGPSPGSWPPVGPEMAPPAWSLFELRGSGRGALELCRLRPSCVSSLGPFGGWHGRGSFSCFQRQTPGSHWAHGRRCIGRICHGNLEAS